MDEDRWERLGEHLARARANPDFDTEERDFRLEIAGALRDVIRIGGEQGPWTDRLQALVTGLFGNRRYDLTERAHNRWLRTLRDPAALGMALACFEDSGADPVDRFSNFVEAAAQQQPQLLVTPTEYTGPHPDRDAVLTFGALLNFACAPEELPAMHLEAWNLVEQTLGYEWSFRRSPAEQYRFHLDFAARGRPAPARRRHRCPRHARHAEPDPHRGRTGRLLDGGPYETADRSPTRTKHELAVCAIYRDEADYLAEWVEFHRLVGAERFFLYNNFSEDHHREVLAPYVEEGLVTVRDWPVLDGRVGQIAAYDDYLRWHRYDSRWIAFIDLDEFLFSPGRSSLPDVLADFEEWPRRRAALGVVRHLGARDAPAGARDRELRPQDRPRRRVNINMKTVADPRG